MVNIVFFIIIQSATVYYFVHLNTYFYIFFFLFRFLCYLNNTHLGLSESTIQLLAKDFSENSLEISHMPPLPLASKQQRKVWKNFCL